MPDYGPGNNSHKNRLERAEHSAEMDSRFHARSRFNALLSKSEREQQDAERAAWREEIFTKPLLRIGPCPVCNDELGPVCHRCGKGFTD